MNPALVVPVISVKFKSALRRTSRYLVYLEDVYIKFRETELVEISQLPRVWIHGSVRGQECRDDSVIYNYQRV